MNLPNKITLFRIIMTFLLVIVLIFPFHTVGINSIKLFINETVVIDIKYIVAGCLFLVASLSDFLDGYIARKYNLVTDLGKVMDAIADKILVNSVLIILSSQGLIHPLLTIIIICRDIVVNAIKMTVGSKKETVSASISGKIKTIFMMVGITLTLFHNLPFELWNINISNVILIIATILSVTSGIEYFQKNKDVLL